MTHEHTIGSPVDLQAFHGHGEVGGPEHDRDLPNAWELPEYDNVEDSLAPPLDGDLED